jgi:hypothetical protein
MPSEHDDAPVFVIDLTHAERARTAREVRAAMGGEFVPRVLPQPPDEPVRWVALLLDAGEPVLLPIAPTRDVRLLDALARLVRFALLQELTGAEVAARHGEVYEQELLARGALPGWTRGELDPEAARRLPPDVRRALGA